MTDDKASILVVDDEEEVTKLFCRGLERAGHKTCPANNGEEALAYLKAGRFDLMLSDIHMPGMRGDELLRQAHLIDPDMAVVMVTAATDVTTAVQCLRDGAFDYIMKPASLSEIAVRVGKALERRRLVLENRAHQANLEVRVAEQAEKIRSLFQHSLEALIQTMEARDESTRNHSGRVADLAASLAARLYPADARLIGRLRVAGLFHDLGKIGVPDDVLKKPGALNEMEMESIRRHPVLGESILRPLITDTEILFMIRHHHEHYNGEGYPDGLAAKELSPGTRILSVADAYDAMISTRPYRHAMSPEHALSILSDGAGTQWDPAVVRAIVALAAEGKLPTRETVPTREVHAAPPVMPQPAPALKPAPTVQAAPTAQSAPRREPPPTVTVTYTPREPETPQRKQSVPVFPELNHARRVGLPSGRRPVIFVQGDMDETIRERIGSKAAAFLAQGERAFLIDMNQAGCIDSEGVQTLYLLNQRLKNLGGHLSLRDTPSHVLVALREAGVAEEFCLEQSPIPSARRSSRFGAEQNEERQTA